MVARRARLSLVPASLVIDAARNIVSGSVEADLGGRKKHLAFEADLSTSFEIECLGNHEYPFDFLRFQTTNQIPNRKQALTKINALKGFARQARRLEESS